MWLGMQLIVIFTRAAWGPAHNNGCGPLPEKVGHFMLYCIYMNISQPHFTVFNFHQNSYKDKLWKLCFIWLNMIFCVLVRYREVFICNALALRFTRPCGWEREKKCRWCVSNVIGIVEQCYGTLGLWNDNAKLRHTINPS